jgi:hypothetical protein
MIPLDPYPSGTKYCSYSGASGAAGMECLVLIGLRTIDARGSGEVKMMIK